MEKIGNAGEHRGLVSNSIYELPVGNSSRYLKRLVAINAFINAPLVDFPIDEL